MDPGAGGAGWQDQERSYSHLSSGVWSSMKRHVKSTDSQLIYGIANTDTDNRSEEDWRRPEPEQAGGRIAKRYQKQNQSSVTFKPTRTGMESAGSFGAADQYLDSQKAGTLSGPPEHNQSRNMLLIEQEQPREVDIVRIDGFSGSEQLDANQRRRLPLKKNINNSKMESQSTESVASATPSTDIGGGGAAGGAYEALRVRDMEQVVNVKKRSPM